MPRGESLFLIRKEGKQISIFLSLGANLSNDEGMAPALVLDRAQHRVLSVPGVSGGLRSRWYSSAPIPAADQPRYLNGVLRLEGEIDPETLLGRLQAIERVEGRVRGTRNAPRTLDIDIIDMHGLVRDSAVLQLPHPRAHERAFVLRPLRDVAPGWQHPMLGLSVGVLIGRLPPQDIRDFSGQVFALAQASIPA
jgi:2-amino-4-hydroxy-6-hydroxymethyldihydropteridine diphosphokinase